MGRPLLWRPFAHYACIAGYPESAGINRHVAGDERALREGKQRIHPGLESCMGRREVFREVPRKYH